MQLAAARRKYDRIHEDRPYHDGTFSRWAEKASDDFPFHYADGVSIRLAETDENPDDLFLGGQIESVVEPGEADEG